MRTILLQIFFIFFLTQKCFAAFLWFQQQDLKSLEGKTDVGKIHNAIITAGYETAQLKQFVVAGANFREVVFEIPDEKVSRKELIDAIKSAYISSVVNKLIALTPPKEINGWTVWFERGTRVGSGQTIEDAFVNLKLTDFGMTFDEWKAKTAGLRESLLAQTKQSKATWNDLLEASRRYGRKKSALVDWCSENRFFQNAVEQIQEYGRLLTLGDYLDPRTLRGQSSTNGFLENSLNDDVFLVLDISGLGVTNRIAQDTWFEKGAVVAQIGTIEQAGSNRISQTLQMAQSACKKFLGYVPQNTFVSGDTIAFSLRKNSNDRFRNLFIYLNSRGDVHVGLGRIDRRDIETSFKKVEEYLKDPSLCNQLEQGYASGFY